MGRGSKKALTANVDSITKECVEYAARKAGVSVSSYMEAAAQRALEIETGTAKLYLTDKDLMAFEAEGVKEAASWLEEHLDTYMPHVSYEKGRFSVMSDAAVQMLVQSCLFQQERAVRAEALNKEWEESWEELKNQLIEVASGHIEKSFFEGYALGSAETKALRRLLACKEEPENCQ